MSRRYRRGDGVRFPGQLRLNAGPDRTERREPVSDQRLPTDRLGERRHELEYRGRSETQQGRVPCPSFWLR